MPPGAAGNNQSARGRHPHQLRLEAVDANGAAAGGHTQEEQPMSWSLSLVAPSKEQAKEALAADPQVQNGQLPKSMVDVTNAAIDAMPPTDMPDFTTLSVATYGHFRVDHPGTSNFTLAIQWVANGPEAQQAA